MTDREETGDVEHLLRAIAADWQTLQAVRRRLPLRVAQARLSGVPGRVIARETLVPERNVRRWVEKAQATEDETAGAA